MDTLGATIGSLFNVVRLFVLFDLISWGSRKNDNLWKSLGGIMGQSVEKPRGYNGRRPRGFLAEGLAEGGLQYTLEGLH